MYVIAEIYMYIYMLRFKTENVCVCDILKYGSLKMKIYRYDMNIHKHDCL